MKEIRIHGRGGQGSVTAAELLAIAAFEDGMYSQAFPSFGVERRGAPVMAFVRLSDKKIRLRSQVYEPDYVIVQDATLIEAVDVAGGLKADGMIIVNTEHNPDDLPLETEAAVKTPRSRLRMRYVTGFRERSERRTQTLCRARTTWWWDHDSACTDRRAWIQSCEQDR